MPQLLLRDHHSGRRLSRRGGRCWRVEPGVGALGVLGVNVAVLLMAGTLTLLVQRRWGRVSTNSNMLFRSAS